MFLLMRLLLGAIFLTSGLEKAISPSENFLYVIQAYQAFPFVLERAASLVFPWVEITVGAFLVLGFWLPITLKVSMMMSTALLLLVGQAIIRALPIDSCGCFGNLVHLPLQGVFALDMAMLAAAFFALKHILKTKRFSIDQWYEK